MRADRLSRRRTLPTRAYRYCEAVTAAAGFGWWVFPPIGMRFIWDGEEIFWTQYDELTDWEPLSLVGSISPGLFPKQRSTRRRRNGLQEAARRPC